MAPGERCRVVQERRLGREVGGALICADPVGRRVAEQAGMATDPGRDLADLAVQDLGLRGYPFRGGRVASIEE